MKKIEDLYNTNKEKIKNLTRNGILGITLMGAATLGLYNNANSTSFCTTIQRPQITAQILDFDKRKNKFVYDKRESKIRKYKSEKELLKRLNKKNVNYVIAIIDNNNDGKPDKMFFKGKRDLYIIDKEDKEINPIDNLDKNDLKAWEKIRNMYILKHNLEDLNKVTQNKINNTITTKTGNFKKITNIKTKKTTLVDLGTIKFVIKKKINDSNSLNKTNSTENKQYTLLNNLNNTTNIKNTTSKTDDRKFFAKIYEVVKKDDESNKKDSYLLYSAKGPNLIKKENINKFYKLFKKSENSFSFIDKYKVIFIDKNNDKKWDKIIYVDNDKGAFDIKDVIKDYDKTYFDIIKKNKVKRFDKKDKEELNNVLKELLRWKSFKNDLKQISPDLLKYKINSFITKTDDTFTITLINKKERDDLLREKQIYKKISFGEHPISIYSKSKDPFKFYITTKTLMGYYNPKTKKFIIGKDRNYDGFLDKNEILSNYLLKREKKSKVIKENVFGDNLAEKKDDCSMEGGYYDSIDDVCVIKKEWEEDYLVNEKNKELEKINVLYGLKDNVIFVNPYVELVKKEKDKKRSLKLKLPIYKVVEENKKNKIGLATLIYDRIDKGKVTEIVYEGNPTNKNKNSKLEKAINKLIKNKTLEEIVDNKKISNYEFGEPKANKNLLIPISVPSLIANLEKNKGNDVVLFNKYIYYSGKRDKPFKQETIRGINKYDIVESASELGGFAAVTKGVGIIPYLGGKLTISLFKWLENSNDIQSFNYEDQFKDKLSNSYVKQILLGGIKGTLYGTIYNLFNSEGLSHISTSTQTTGSNNVPPPNTNPTTTPVY